MRGSKLATSMRAYEIVAAQLTIRSSPIIWYHGQWIVPCCLRARLGAAHDPPDTSRELFRFVRDRWLVMSLSPETSQVALVALHITILLETDINGFHSQVPILRS